MESAKHLWLSMTLRHWPGSAELITLLNRYVTVNLTPWLLCWKLPLLIRFNKRTTFYHLTLLWPATRLVSCGGKTLVSMRKRHLVPRPPIPHMALSSRNCKMAMSRSKPFLLIFSEQKIDHHNLSTITSQHFSLGLLKDRLNQSCLKRVALVKLIPLGLLQVAWMNQL